MLTEGGDVLTRRLRCDPKCKESHLLLLPSEGNTLLVASFLMVPGLTDEPRCRGKGPESDGSRTFLD
jgi:hypothetical protein